MLSRCLTSLLLAVSALPAEKGPDSVRLKDGRVLTGRVVYEGPEALRIERGASEIEVKKRDAVEIQTLERSLAEFLRRFDAIRRDDAAALSDLAKFCASRGLEHEARNLWIRVLIANPGDAAALEGAGGRSVAGKAQLQSGARWLELDAWRGAKPRWKDAVELRTTHFLVRTDLPLDRVLDAAVRLERSYQRFYEFFAPEVALYVFQETPEVELFSNEKDYPASWTAGARSWFGAAENKLHVLVTEQLDLKQIVHDLTDLLLFNAFRRSSGKTGQIPPWSVEGLADYFAATAGEKLGDPWTPLGQPYPPLFRAFTGAPKPLPMKQLMRTSLTEFLRASDAAQRSGQAYSLVHYLMHGDGQKHRELFFHELRQAWKGKSIEDELLKSLGMNEAQLQAAVLEHARANGG